MTPQKFLGSMSKMGVYGKETLSCNDHIDENTFELVNKPLIELLII